MRRTLAMAVLLLVAVVARATEWRVLFSDDGGAFVVTIDDTPAPAITSSRTPATPWPTPGPSQRAVIVASTATPGRAYRFRVCAPNPGQPDSCSAEVTAAVPTSTATASASSSATATPTSTPTQTPTATPTRRSTPRIYDITGNGAISALDAARYFQRGELPEALCALRVSVGFPADCET